MPLYTRRAALPVLLLALYACGGPEPLVQGPRPVVVESPRALDGATTAETLPGSVHARVEAELSFRVPGKLAERRVDMGAHVNEGSVLAVLDPQDARLNMTAAQATVAAAEADVQLARTEEQRFRELHARSFVGQSELDLRVNTTRLAEARLDQARAHLDLAKNQSRYTQLSADAPGVVTQVLAEPGNVLAAGQPVLRFAGDGERELHVNVPEGRIATFSQAALEIEMLSNPGHLYRGRIRDMDPQADGVTRMHRARITILDADESVHLGASATVFVSTPADGRSFLLPATALSTIDGGHTVVWRVTGTQSSQVVEAVSVEVLRYFDAGVAVAGPLSPEDRVVSAGAHRLHPGMAVEAIDRATRAAL